MARTKKGDVVFKKNIHIKSQNQKLDTDKDIKGFPTTLMGLYFRIITRFPFYFSVMFSLKTARQFAGMVSGSLISMWTFGLFENVSNVNLTMLLTTLGMIWMVAAASDFAYFFESFIRGRRLETVNRYRHSIIYKRLLKNDTQYFIDKPSGRMIMQIQTIHSGQDTLTIEFWSQIIGAVLGFLFVAGYVVGLNVWMAVIIIGNGIFRIFWQMFVQKKINVLKKEMQAVGAAFQGARSDCFDNALTVKFFANERTENAFMLKQRSQLPRLYKRDFFLDRLRFVPTSVAWGVMDIVVLAMCFFAIRDGSMTVSDAAFVVTAAGAITSAFARLNDLLRKYSETRARTEQAFSDLFVDVAVQDHDGAKKLIVKKACVQFDDVTFAYHSKDVLKHFSLDIAPGERVGVVGLSGAGKTTLVNLMLRAYDVKSGAIKIDGVDISDVTQESLRKNIALVPQETTLFNRTILDNIRYAKPTASRADVIKAAKKANIHEFIMGLANGYDTLVGNRGIKLSGGQRQRIAIARAILKDAPVLILDEATSALDSENEVLIQSALQKVMRGKTTIAIAHRLSTLRNMDRIIVMNKGKIVAVGTHTKLLREKGLYRKLWGMQTGGFFGK